MEKKKECLKNLKKCKAICCSSFPVNIPSDYKRNKKLYDLKGCKIMTVRFRGYKRKVLVMPSKCKALTKNSRCSLWNTKKIPRICKWGYNKIKRGMVIPKGCIYYKN